MSTWTAAFIDDLPDSSFAYVEPGGTKDKGGMTVPRSLRHLPYKDADGKVDLPHLRNALARLPQSDLSADAKASARKKLEAAAAAAGVGDAARKAAFEMKAEPLTTSQLDRWLSGKTSRRVLVVPFGGPIPSKASLRGVDLDGEWFDEDTDLFGPYKALRSSRERLVDWHHDVDPKGRMKGAILGHVVLDAEPDDDGLWADWWANAGEERRRLIARLERSAVPLYGSSQAVYRKARDDGHIDEWPLIRHTITTSPQNTFAVVPPLKAILTADDIPFDEIGLAAIKAALLGLGDLSSELLASFPTEAVAASSAGGDPAVNKAGRTLSTRNEAQLRAFLDELAAWVDSLTARYRITDGETDQ